MSAQLQARTMTSAASGPQLEIDLEAIAENTRTLVGAARGEVMAVVKADGFGHGALAVAATALTHGATSLGVTSIDEALVLRRAGLAAPVLSWLNSPEADFASAIAVGIEIGIPSPEHLTAVVAAAELTGRVARVHLHADTGLARDGAAPAEWARLCRAAAAHQVRGRLEVVGLMGHLPCADRPGDEANADARDAFDRFTATARRAGLRHVRRHLAATAATLTDPLSHHDMCRVGAGLVGIDPSGTTALRPAMTVRAPLVTVRDVPRGTGVGYGHTVVTDRATRLGLLPLGYADGLPRAASDRAEVMVQGRRCPVVGLVSMDQVVVDLGDLPARPGDLATVMGPGDAGEPTVADWADWSGTVPHAIVVGLGPRLARSTLPATSPRLRVLSTPTSRTSS
jgi:alanine racemase